MTSSSQNPKRPIQAFIPARYARESSRGYEHSRRSAAPAALALTVLFYISSAAALAAVIRAGWVPTLIPPRAGVHSIQLTASLASAASEPQQIVIIKPMTEQSPQKPAGAGRPEMAPRSISRVGRVASAGLPINAPPKRDRAAGGLAVPQLQRAEAKQQPEMQTDSEPTKRAANQRRAASSASAASIATRASEGVRKSAPRPIDNPQPEFPPQLLAAEIEGAVVVRATVRGDGRVSRVRIHQTSGYAAFDRSAMAAVKRWRFDTDANVSPDSTVNVNVPLRFRIER